MHDEAAGPALSLGCEAEAGMAEEEKRASRPRVRAARTRGRAPASPPPSPARSPDVTGPFESKGGKRLDDGDAGVTAAAGCSSNPAAASAPALPAISLGAAARRPGSDPAGAPGSPPWRRQAPRRRRWSLRRRWRSAVHSHAAPPRACSRGEARQLRMRGEPDAAPRLRMADDLVQDPDPRAITDHERMQHELEDRASPHGRHRTRAGRSSAHPPASHRAASPDCG